ncbi:MAG: nitrophenyl compound nitroreductase subunit ArsF family protein [Proteobacteria bacterium]|nr:nitrophenyl compound nitroreductase subunit ArsF family protein [Pseudomonadota bacterium]
MTGLPRTKTIIMLALVAAVAATGCNRPAAAAGDAQKATGDVQKAASDTPKAAANPNAAPDKIIVYYFHATRRCPTCLGIQDNIEQTINEKFAEETTAGKLSFEEVNFEEDANKHFVDEYQLSFSTMIVAAQASGKTVKWENAEKVWEHAHNAPALKEYVEKMIRTYLAKL